MSEEELAVKRLLKLGAALLDKGYESLANACTESARVITDLERENADLRAKLAEAERKLADVVQELSDLRTTNGFVLEEGIRRLDEAKRWKEAIIDGLLASSIYSPFHEENARKALSDLLAQAEHRGADAARREAAGICKANVTAPYAAELILARLGQPAKEGE